MYLSKYTDQLNPEHVIKLVEEFIKTKLEENSNGHDWYHIERVMKLSKAIAEQENADSFLCQISALSHEIEDYKVSSDPERDLEELKELLNNQGINKELIDEIINIIRTIPFREQTPKDQLSLEAKIVQDADRLDAIGAIGIARTFIYAGSKGHQMYNPDQKPRLSMTKEEYMHDDVSAIKHFYEKLLKLKDLMNTEYAKKEAEKRHRFLEEYLEQFYKEWEGEM